MSIVRFHVSSRTLVDLLHLPADTHILDAKSVDIGYYGQDVELTVDCPSAPDVEDGTLVEPVFMKQPEVVLKEWRVFGGE